MKPLLIILFYSISICSYAQTEYQILGLPTLNFGKKINKDWNLNIRTEFRQHYFSTQDESSLNYNFEYIHTDLAGIVTKKVGLNNKLGLGFQLRYATKSEKRFIQQFNIVTEYYAYKLGHRFAADQTFVPTKNPSYRLRYRITFEKALNGNVANAKEWYFKLGHEYLYKTTFKQDDVEIRIIPNFGYVFKSKNKLELGLDYRYNGFINNYNRHRFFLALNWFAKL